MSVRIRLRRAGAKKHPTYRVVVADSRAPRDGAFIETIGHYNPLTDPETVKINGERARLWLQRGAQPTEAVARLLSKTGVTEAPGHGVSTPTPAEDAQAGKQSETSEEPES